MGDKKLHIHIYTTYLTSTHLCVKGRILKDAPLVSKNTHGILASLFYTALRALSREIGGADVLCKYGEYVWRKESDSEGYFEVFERIENHNDHAYAFAEISVHKGRRSGITAAPIVNLSTNVPLGIISDVDDTVMVTGVKSLFKLRLLINTLFLNPFRRKPITDAADAFHSLVDNAKGPAPIIYLSNSPWNLFEYLRAFLTHNGFPEGILLLRDMGSHLLGSRSIQDRNKYIEIKKILIAFPSAKFILIGDTGEIDYDIYRQILDEHPDRIVRVILNRAGKLKNERRILEGFGADARFTMISGYTDFVSRGDR